MSYAERKDKLLVCKANFVADNASALTFAAFAEGYDGASPMIGRFSEAAVRLPLRDRDENVCDPLHTASGSKAFKKLVSFKSMPTIKVVFISRVLAKFHGIVSRFRYRYQISLPFGKHLLVFFN